jgi:hypothetical protein
MSNGPRSRAPASESGRTCRPRNAPPCCGAPATCGSSTARRSASGWCARQDRSRPRPDWRVSRRRRSVTKRPRYRQHPAGHVLPSAEPRWRLARRRPVGVVTVIAPFSFPLILSIRSVAPALDPIGGAEGTRALGNAVLLKPDPRTAVCWGVALLRVFQEVSLPAGLLWLLPGESRWPRLRSPQLRSGWCR